MIEHGRLPEGNLEKILSKQSLHSEDRKQEKKNKALLQLVLEQDEIIQKQEKKLSEQENSSLK